MRLALTEFHGIAPKLDRRRLPAGVADLAENVKFDAGDLQPIRAPQTGQIITGDIGNLHWYRFGDDEKLIAFGSNLETYGFRTPVPNDEHSRWYWNVRGEGLQADEAGLFAIADPVNPSPAYAASSVGSGADFREFRGYNVGIPAPQTSPEITDNTEAAAVGFDTDNAVASMSRTNPVTVNTTTEHGFSSGDRVKITIDPDFPKADEDDEGGDGVPPQIVFDVTNVQVIGGNIVLDVDPSVVKIEGTHIRLASSNTAWDGHGLIREILSTGSDTITIEGPDPGDIENVLGTATATVVNENGDVATVEGQVWQLDGVKGVLIGVTAFQFDISGVSTTGFQEFTEAELAAIRIERDFVDDDLESRAYVFTYVSEFDEEGPPSEPSNILDIPKAGGSVRMELSDVDHNFSAHGGSRRNIDRIRVYRTVAGTTDTLFVFVGELGFGGTDGEGVSWAEPPGPSSDPVVAWSAELVDNVDSVSLGEPLASQGWFPPPKGLWGVHLLPNGFAVGWKNNTLYFSDPYLPHAWDPENKRTTDDDIVGVQSFGNTLVIGTRGRPYIAHGVDPMSIQLRKLELHAPLLHRRAIVDVGSGVFYPSTNGLVWVGAGGARYLTDHSYDKRTWEQAVENRPQGVFHDRRGLLFGPGQKPLMIDVNSDIPEFSEVDMDIGAAVQAGSQMFAVIQAADNQYRQVIAFKEEMPPLEANWKSGIMTTPKPCNLSVGQVYADGYPVTLRIGYADLEPDGQPDLDQITFDEYTVAGPEAFRMNPGHLSREFIIELVSEHRIQQVIVSTSMDDLRAAP